MEVHTAGTGKEGLEMAEQLGGPDVALVDLRLPDVDGIQVVRDLKAKHADTAVIMITAFGHIESAVSAIKNGATDYLEKPFQHLEKLRIAVTRSLEEVKAKREIHRLTRREEGKYRDSQAVRQLNPHLHNVPLQIAVERGLPALAIWLWFVVTLMRDFIRQRRVSVVPSLAAGGLACVVAMLAAGMFEYNFGDSEFLMLFLVLVTLPYAAEPAGTASRLDAAAE